MWSAEWNSIPELLKENPLPPVLKQNRGAKNSDWKTRATGSAAGKHKDVHRLMWSVILSIK